MDLVWDWVDLPEWHLWLWSVPTIGVRLRNFFFFFCFLGPHPQHMEVPKLGVEIGATAAYLHHSHSNVGFEPCL